MNEIHEHTYKWYKFGCKDATYLSTKAEYSKLSFSEKFLFSFHLVICKYCRRFVEQTQKLQDFLKNRTEKSQEMMGENKKLIINQEISNILSKS
jgi:hypothetical protein